MQATSQQLTLTLTLTRRRRLRHRALRVVAPGAGAVVGSSAVGRRKAAAEKKKRRVTLSFLPAGKRLFLDPPANFTGSATKANPHTTGRPCRLPAGRYRYRAHLVTSIITTC